ncbi:helix-turn-helix domain-containing protein [Thalassospira profundimaris]|uniref:helix-turn-helix domain-containing protein n=1 Tax=Thalassospira profundimaris TaxID=502049 RepID=UPI000DED3C91|nr:helix-turn-helix transcriptional regulator [Thalassospira profundimaris]
MLNLWQIGREIQAARKFRKIRQEDLARDAGIARSTLSALERGQVTELGFGKISLLLNLLGLELKVIAANNNRPTLEELMAEDDQGLE